VSGYPTDVAARRAGVSATEVRRMTELGLSFEEIGAVQLKGISGLVELYAAR
jgi:hypothetical protein